MKKLSLIFILAAATFSSYAQSSFKEDLDVVQSVNGCANLAWSSS